jgi:hypothetical protein
MNRTEIIKLWVEWFDYLVIYTYKKKGKDIITIIKNKMSNMENTWLTNTNDEIDIYNNEIDKLTNKIMKIENCISNDAKLGDGLDALFNTNLLSKDNFIFLLNETEYPIELFYKNDNFNINNGFDIIYDDFLLNKLFNNHNDTKNHLIFMRSLIIMNLHINK